MCTCSVLTDKKARRLSRVEELSSSDARFSWLTPSRRMDDYLTDRTVSAPDLLPALASPLSPLRLLVVVISAPENSAQRDLVRATWKARLERGGRQRGGVSVVFSVGVSRRQEVNVRISNVF